MNKKQILLWRGFIILQNAQKKIYSELFRTGNCQAFEVKSKDRSVGIIGILDNGTSFPTKFPFKIIVFLTLFIILFAINLVPLQSRDGLMFRKRTIVLQFSMLINT